MANKFEGRWKSEIEQGGAMKPDGEFTVRDGTAADRVIVRKPADGSPSDDTDGIITSGDKIEFTSNGIRYSGKITINDDLETRPIEATIDGEYRRVAQPLPDGLQGGKQEYSAEQSTLQDDDDWQATRPPGE